MNWVNYLKNPQMMIMKKYLFDILKEKFSNHEEITERISSSLTTSKDMEKFVQLVADIYESGFMASLEKQKEAFKKAGCQVSIIGKN